MIKAIETRYKGYRFRSRLEARWAVFFDVMGWQWEYEPEGFDMEGIYYLPDFKVFGKDSNGDDNVFYFEVKPSEKPISPLEKEKIMKFAHACHDDDLTRGYGDFVILDGPPDSLAYLSAGAFFDPDNWPYEPLWWAMDIEYREGRPTFEVDGNYNEDKRKSSYLETKKCFGSDYSVGSPAIEKARSARFEHGERP